MKNLLMAELEYNTTRYLDTYNVYDDKGKRITKELVGLFYNASLEDLLTEKLIIKLIESIDLNDLLILIYNHNKEVNR